MNTKKCLICGREFKPSSNSQKFCSVICREINSAKTKGTIVHCAFCGKKMEANTKYCSDECRQKGSHLPRCMKRKKPKFSIDLVAKLSREAGMSYGKYVQLHGIY